MLLEHPELRGDSERGDAHSVRGCVEQRRGLTRCRSWLQKDTDLTVASLILCLESVFVVLAGALVLHQIPTGRELAGCVLMFVGHCAGPAGVSPAFPLLFRRPRAALRCAL